MKSLFLYIFLLLSFTHFVVRGMLPPENAKRIAATDFLSTMEDCLRKAEDVLNSMNLDLCNTQNTNTRNIFNHKKDTVEDYFSQIEKLEKNAGLLIESIYKDQYGKQSTAVMAVVLQHTHNQYNEDDITMYLSEEENDCRE
jgi:hypothetical protein